MENKYQEKFGYPAERTAGKVRAYMAEWIQSSSGSRRFAFSRRAMPMAIATRLLKAASLDLSRC